MGEADGKEGEGEISRVKECFGAEGWAAMSEERASVSE